MGKNRPTGVFKKTNDYQKLLSPEFYDKCPKAVFAALAVSYALNYAGAGFENITKYLSDEWDILNKNGIVQQKSISL